MLFTIVVTYAVSGLDNVQDRGGIVENNGFPCDLHGASLGTLSYTNKLWHFWYS